MVVTDVFFIPGFYQDNADAVLSEGPINSFPSLLVVCMWTTQAVEKRTKGGAPPASGEGQSLFNLLHSGEARQQHRALKLQFQNISNASQLLPKCTLC